MEIITPDRTFGEINGTPIKNKDTILTEINKCLGKSKNPSIEYIITLPYSIVSLPYNLGGLNYNSFGHSALRFDLIFEVIRLSDY